jgi:GNAT superfamily N-acetyltransferase
VPAADRLAELLADAAAGCPPPADACTEVLPADDGAAAVLGFTAHHVVVADVDPSWVSARLPPGDLSAPLGAAFVAALASHLGRRAGALDVVLVASGRAGDAPVALTPTDDHAHPRVRRALHHRRDVRAFAAERDTGVVVIGRGLAGRWEAAFEVDAAARGRGLGRRLAAAALHLVPEHEPVFLQVSPGNVASLHAVLAAGFTPIGSEVLLTAR